MVIKIRKGARLHYYIKEHMRHRGISDQVLAGRIGTSPETVYRRYTEQHRLTPDKVAEIADALDMHPSELLFPPGIPSLDAIAHGAEPADRMMIADIVRRMRQKG